LSLFNPGTREHRHRPSCATRASHGLHRNPNTRNGS
jgi:hypothetical protein